MLFFSSAPLDIGSSAQEKLGHSLKYLAAKEERRGRVEERKRKLAHEHEERQKTDKRVRADEESELASRVEGLTNRAVQVTADRIVAGTNMLYQALYSDQAENAKLSDINTREHTIAADRTFRVQTAQIQAESTKASFVNLRGNAMYLDDIDPGT